MTNPTMKFYHGTTAARADEVMDNPQGHDAINGWGFYMTRDIEVARQYGEAVICYEVSHKVADELQMITRPIDQRYTEDMELYRECVAGGMETVITSQKALVHFIVEMEDSYIIPKDSK